MRSVIIVVFCLTIFGFEVFPQDSITYSWRYYRPGNTGIQGDQVTALWIDEIGDPYIAATQVAGVKVALQNSIRLKTNG